MRSSSPRRRRLAGSSGPRARNEWASRLRRHQARGWRSPAVGPRARSGRPGADGKEPPGRSAGEGCRRSPEGGAQDLMAPQHLTERPLQGGGVETAGQADGLRLLYAGLSGSTCWRNQNRCWAKERGTGRPSRGTGRMGGAAPWLGACTAFVLHPWWRVPPRSPSRTARAAAARPGRAARVRDISCVASREWPPSYEEALRPTPTLSPPPGPRPRSPPAPPRRGVRGGARLASRGHRSRAGGEQPQIDLAGCGGERDLVEPDEGGRAPGCPAAASGGTGADRSWPEGWHPPVAATANSIPGLVHGAGKEAVGDGVDVVPVGAELVLLGHRPEAVPVEQREHLRHPSLAVGAGGIMDLHHDLIDHRPIPLVEPRSTSSSARCTSTLRRSTCAIPSSRSTSERRRRRAVTSSPWKRPARRSLASASRTSASCPPLGGGSPGSA